MKIGVRTTKEQRPGVCVFYIDSFNEKTPDVVHSVVFSRKGGWKCECGNFFWVKQAKRRHCKHAKTLVKLSREFHGVVKLAQVLRSNGLVGPKQIELGC